jgi:hypothetical protein
LPDTRLCSAIDYLAACDVGAVRLHAARTLARPRKFGPIQALRDEAEKDMFARDVRELFLLPYVEARRTGRLRGRASGILGTVLSSNASVALDALLARGCQRPVGPVPYLLDDMLSRGGPHGYFFEPYQRGGDGSAATDESKYAIVTAAYVRYLIAYGRGRDRRVRGALDWLVEHQDEDGAWRPRDAFHRRDETQSYLLTRAVAAAFAELPATGMKRYATARRKLAAAWSSRILERCHDPDAVLTRVNIAEDPRGPARHGDGPDLPPKLRDRVLYFPLEDLWLALSIGAAPTHSHLAPWIEWLMDTQLADGSWRLGNPGLRERLLLSDPNGRLRAEALHLTDPWITLRAAQILHLCERRARTRVSQRH